MALFGLPYITLTNNAILSNMSKKGMGEAVAFSPGHITGFFEICDQSEDSLHKGSRGAGICIAQGVKTRVKVEPSAQNRVEIKINGDETNSALISQEVVNLFLTRLNYNLSISVEHEVQIPIGCGLGASGASSLSLALVLNKVLGRMKSNTVAAQIAHQAEIKFKTGLGTVLAQTKGGLEIRKQAGAPGFGKVESIPIGKEYRIVGLILEKIPTEQVLIDKLIRKRINEHGSKALNKFIKQPGINQFMEISRDFAESVGLISSRLRKIIDILDRQGFLCSQAMFGETLFSIVKESDAPRLIEIFRQSSPVPHWIINTETDNDGARLL